jgi:hypothetical protein
MKKQIIKQLLIFLLLVLASGIQAQEVGFGYSGSLILDNRISEALPVFGPSATLALDARISEALPLYGFSDVFTAFTVVTIHLDNTGISPPTDTCMQALQNIVLSDVVVENNARLELVAGENILILNVTQVETGAYLRAYIDDTWLVCQQVEAMLAATDQIEEDFLERPPAVDREQFFTIYPNPTTGILTLLLNEPAEEGSIIVEIYSLMGEMISHMLLGNRQHYQFSLGNLPAGIYLVRVMKGDEVETDRFIKQ